MESSDLAPENFCESALQTLANERKRPFEIFVSNISLILAMVIGPVFYTCIFSQNTMIGKSIILRSLNTPKSF